MHRTNKIYRHLGLLCLLLHSNFQSLIAQSGQLQLNLILEPDQTLEWTREYPVHLADGIPANIILGKLTGENTLIGLFKTRGTGNRLVLHGIENETRYILTEWLDNSTETGSIRLQREQDSIWGHWYNERKSLRLDIHSVPKGPGGRMHDEIRQYQYGDYIFFTHYSKNQEKVLKNFMVNSETWNGRYMPYKKCYTFEVKSNNREFCRTGVLGLYYYSHADIGRIIYGYVPQIPHDATFNSRISEWLSQWSNGMPNDSLQHMVDQRWSRRQTIRFNPDYITDELISGLLSIQYTGDSVFHAKTILYDRRKKIFYQPDDFFRSNTRWNEGFQKTAKKYIYNMYQQTIDIFPEVLDHVKFHLTINPSGLVISTDFTPYFGRLKVQVDQTDFKDDLQRFAPFRKLLAD